jgi:hypothetical protein
MKDRIDIFDSLKLMVRDKLTVKQRAAARHILAKPLSLFYGGNLRRLAQLYGSDKWGDHWYCQHYERHLSHLRRKKITLLEIGIGGYADPKSGGRSLRMWRRYFYRGRICGIDIVDKTGHNGHRIETYRGDQSDAVFLRHVIDEIGSPDIIIDDGSHVCSHVRKTFEILFPLLAENGTYVIEDTQTSYWREFGGDSYDLHSGHTSMCMLKGLADGLNHAEYRRPGYVPTYFDKHVVSVHFYHNIVFIEKGPNEEDTSKYGRAAAAIQNSEQLFSIPTEVVSRRLDA